jgi:hypothetical protein
MYVLALFPVAFSQSVAGIFLYSPAIAAILANRLGMCFAYDFFTTSE